MKHNQQNKIKSIIWLRAFALSAILTIAFFSTVPEQAHAQGGVGKIRATYDNWQLKCGKAPGSRSEKCALVQSVAAEDRPNVGLTVIFLRSIDGKKKLLRVIAPLGVLLPTGLGLKIDNVDVGHAKFLKCGKIGCIAEVQVSGQLEKQFKNGGTAVFIIFQTPEAGIGIPIPLRGFNRGLAQLR